MMVLTNRADQAAPLWQAAVAVLAEVASMAHAKPVSRQSVDYSQRIVLRSNSGSFATFAAMRRGG